MGSITVTIPNQPFNKRKYLKEGDYNRCYLEEALDEAGYTNSVVLGSGITIIGNKKYKPQKHFCCYNVEENLNAGRDITVTLIPC